MSISLTFEEMIVREKQARERKAKNSALIDQELLNALRGSQNDYIVGGSLARCIPDKKNASHYDEGAERVANILSELEPEPV